LLVVITVGMILLTTVIASTLSARRSIAIEQTGRKLLLDIRSLQNKALAVRPIFILGVPVTPYSYIVHISKKAAGNKFYTLFADINNNNTYEAGTDVLIGDVYFQSGIIMQDISAPHPQETNIVLRLPSASLGFFNPVSGNPIATQSVTAVLEDTVTGNTRTLTIYTTGMISLR